MRRMNSSFFLLSVLYTLLWCTVLIKQGAGAEKRSRRVTRMTGGQKVEIAEFPYTVSIRDVIYHICGGSIVHPFWILTAAHCVIEEDRNPILSVQFGLSNISENKRNSVQVQKIIVHEKYVPDHWKHDIALLKLKTPIGPSAKLPLPTALTHTDTTASLIGWGRPSMDEVHRYVLHKAEVHILSDRDCSIALNKMVNITGEVVYGSLANSTELILCTHDRGKGLCPGDSGGPLVVDDIQVGIMSFLEPPCGGMYPSGYTRVSAYVLWIFEKITLD